MFMSDSVNDERQCLRMNSQEQSTMVWVESTICLVANIV